MADHIRPFVLCQICHFCSHFNGCRFGVGRNDCHDMTLYPTTHNAHKISVTTCHLPICGSSSKSPIYHSKRWSSLSPLSAIDVDCSKCSSRTSISTHAMIWWTENCTKKAEKDTQTTIVSFGSDHFVAQRNECMNGISSFFLLLRYSQLCLLKTFSNSDNFRFTFVHCVSVSPYSVQLQRAILLFSRFVWQSQFISIHNADVIMLRFSIVPVPYSIALRHWLVCVCVWDACTNRK